MTTIASSTQTPQFKWPSGTDIDRPREVSGSYFSPGHQTLYCMVKTNTNDYTPYRTDNNGTSWTAKTTLTRANILEWSGIFCDMSGFHWAYRVNESGNDTIYFRYYDYATDTWFGEQLGPSASNGGTGGSVFSGIDIEIVNFPWNGETRILIVSGFNSGGNRGIYLWTAVGYTPNIGSIFSSGNIGYLLPESGSGHIQPSCDMEFVDGSDGKTSAWPNVWISFGRANANRCKLLWNSGATWTPANTSYVSNGLITQADSVTGRWDGQRWLQCLVNPGNTQTVAVYEMNASNGWIDNQRFTPSHPTGVVRQCTIAINYSTHDFRVYAVGTSNDTLYYTEFTRGPNTFSAWTQVSATAILDSGASFNVRKSNYGNSRYDIVFGSTNLQTHISHLYNSAPNGGVWVYPPNGAAQDVNKSMRLDWNFSDPNAGDSQSAYALSRQIGAGALNYWRASDSTWQVAEVQNTSGSTAIGLSSGWGAGTDANYTFKVKTWDASNVPGPYGSGLVVVPSVVVQPTITSPTASQVLSTNQVAVVWTVAEQTAFRVALYDTDTPPAINLNPYFEVDTSDWTGVNGATISRDTGFFDQGVASMKVLPDGVNSTPKAQTSVYVCPARQLVRMRMRIRGNGSTITCKITFNDSSGNFLRSSNVSTGTVAGTWQTFELSCLSPDGTGQMQLSTESGPSTATSWFVDEAIMDFPVYDTGWKAETNPVTRSHVPTTILDDGSLWTVGLHTQNLEGLPVPDGATDAFSVSYLPPAVPTVTATAMPTLGLIRLVMANPSPGGAPITFVNAASAVTSNNASLSPSVPASVQKEDLLVCLVSTRNSGVGTVNTPTGWTNLLTFGNVTVLGRLAQLTADAPTITFSGGAAGDDNIAEMVAFRGAALSISASATVLNGSAANVAYPSLTVPVANQLVMVAGWKQDAWTSVATLAGMAEIEDTASSLGNKASQGWDYVIQTTASNITGASFTVTGGVSAISRGLTFAINVKPALLWNDVYRRVVGDTSSGLRIATGLQANATFDDFTAVSGVTYEYRVNAVAQNGTTKFGAWTQ